MQIKKFIPEFLKIPKIRKIIFLGGVGILLLLFAAVPSSSEKKDNKSSEYPNISDIKEKAEKEAEKFLLKIDSVSEADVMISYSDSGRKDYGKNIKTTGKEGENSSDSQIAIKRSGSSEEAIEERFVMPEIKGVSVIIRGDKNCISSVARAVSAGLGAEIHKVEVIVNEEK